MSGAQEPALASRSSRIAGAIIDTMAPVLVAGSYVWIRMLAEVASGRFSPGVLSAMPHVLAAVAVAFGLLQWRRDRAGSAATLLAGGALVSGSAVLRGLLDLGTGADAAALAIVSVAIFILFTGQSVLISLRGQSLGEAVLGIAVERTDGGRAGFARAVLLRSWAALVVALGLGWFVPWPGRVPWWAGAAAAFAILRFVDALFALGASRRTLRGLLSGTRVVVRDGEEHRAYVPPRFSGVGFVWAVFGLIATGGLCGLVYVGVAALGVESTDFDLPTLAVAVAAPLSLAAFGAIASFAARRFIVGELALTSLIAGWLLFDVFSLGLFPVPALQRYDLAGPLDWAVYAISLYFGTIVFFIIGSAVGFMVARDEPFGPRRLGEWVVTGLLPIVWLFAKLGLSREFEWQVARRHLRLSWRHWVQLAIIATLVPILVYGLVIWPIRAVWRLMEGRGVEKPMPPTVFMSLLTIVGVMFGVASLNVVLAVMGGFERDLKEKILGTNAHGVVHRYVGDFDEWRDVQAKARAVPGVVGTTPFILSEGMIVAGEAVTGAVIKGIDVESVGSVTDLEKYIDVDDGSLQNLLYPDRIPKKKRMRDSADGEPVEDDEALPGIIVGREMARSLHVWIGDRVNVMNPLGELGPTGYVPRGRPFRVAAIFVSGMYEYDTKFAYVQLREAQRFYRLGDTVSGIELRFANVDEARPLMKKISGVLGGFPYRTKDWGEMNANLFSALRLERVVMFILLSFQVLIACICVIATLVMLVVEKRKEVATLKAMGAREGAIMKLFVVEGLIIGAIGVFYGSSAGFLFCKLIEKYGVGLDPEVYYITRLPVVIEPSAFLYVGLVAMLLVFVATIYPARRGGSIAPVEGFRDE